MSKKVDSTYNKGSRGRKQESKYRNKDKTIYNTKHGRILAEKMQKRQAKNTNADKKKN